MEAVKEEEKHTIEPQFLSRAQEAGVTVRVGQMNKTEFEGTVSDIGRYDINLNVSGTVVTLLKQEITHITSPSPLLAAAPAPDKAAPDQSASSPTRPNVQQEFLDKAIKEHHPLSLYLLNGNRIRAVIEAYDNFTILLAEGGKQHLYYKHAITTINR